MIERQMHARNKRQIGGDVAFRNFDLAVLHVLGMDELDLVDHVELVEQNGADQAIEIAARHETIFLVGHASLPKQFSAG